jgi:hypothetical protein
MPTLIETVEILTPRNPAELTRAMDGESFASIIASRKTEKKG